MTLCQEESQFSRIRLNLVLCKCFFVDFVDMRNFGLRRGGSGLRQEAMPKTGPTKTSGCFGAVSLDVQFFHERGGGFSTTRCDEVLEVKIGVEDKTIDQPLVLRERPAYG